MAARLVFDLDLHVFVFNLQELFFKYSWNNFLHTQVEKCITTVLNNPPTEEDGEQCTPLVDVVSLLVMFTVLCTIKFLLVKVLYCLVSCSYHLIF